MTQIEKTNLWQCKLIMMDYLFFATTKKSSLVETGSFIHNYSLTYAMGLASSSWYTKIQKPTYERDLEKIQNIYVTPANLIRGSYNIISSRSAQNTYRIIPTGKNKYKKIKCFKPGSTFRFYIMTRNQTDNIPSCIRLGKFLAKAKLIKRCPEKINILEGNFTATPVLNWNDMSVEPNLCNVILHSISGRLIENANFTRKRYIKARFSNGDEARIPLDMGYFRKNLCSSWWNAA
ncbi:type I-D CRISPR-associated protein Cas5/Csc1 [Candidatus Poribacteria bacterium]|nr:type I-D CRISPR-associated protein Cas5/Csc1 [Candidatus Poribacteria bacterium]